MATPIREFASATSFHKVDKEDITGAIPANAMACGGSCDQFVAIDDVDALYADRSGVRLLKCLCQTEEEKTVAWHSDAKSLERQGIPREFVTRSRVAIIANPHVNNDAGTASSLAVATSFAACTGDDF